MSSAVPKTRSGPIGTRMSLSISVTGSPLNEFSNVNCVWITPTRWANSWLISTAMYSAAKSITSVLVARLGDREAAQQPGDEIGGDGGLVVLLEVADVDVLGLADVPRVAKPLVVRLPDDDPGRQRVVAGVGVVEAVADVDAELARRAGFRVVAVHAVGGDERVQLVRRALDRLLDDLVQVRRAPGPTATTT